MIKPILRIHAALQDDIQDLKTRRPLPTNDLPNLDPFLFLNHHGPQVYPPKNHGLPFGPHPHRGFETVTFILKGEIAHKDSSGGENIIKSGGIQWMTAGKGLIHSEVSSQEFMDKGGELEILQLWINLPARLKMTQPKYTGLQRAEIPLLERDKAKVKIQLISGDFEYDSAPLRSLTDVRLMLIELKDTGHLQITIPPVEQVLFYVVKGEVTVNGRRIKTAQLVEFDVAGDNITIEANMDSVILFGNGLPFGEPIVAYGPFVMNSREEIEQAIKDVKDGTLS